MAPLMRFRGRPKGSPGRRATSSPTAIQFPDWRGNGSLPSRGFYSNPARSTSLCGKRLRARISKPFAGFGTVWGLWHFLISAQSGVVATTGTVMIAVLPLIVGVQLLLQAVTLDIQSAPTTPLHATVMLVKGEHPLDR